MLNNAYLGAKIGFDTEENELSEVGCAAGYQLYFYLLSSTQQLHHSGRFRSGPYEPHSFALGRPNSTPKTRTFCCLLHSLRGRIALQRPSRREIRRRRGLGATSGCRPARARPPLLGQRRDAHDDISACQANAKPWSRAARQCMMLTHC